MHCAELSPGWEERSRHGHTGVAVCSSFAGMRHALTTGWGTVWGQRPQVSKPAKSFQC